MLRVGIIGCGKIAQVRHIPEYQANPDAEVVALFDVNTERARGLAEELGCRAYDTMEALLADADVDAVSVCTSNATHAQSEISALEAGTGSWFFDPKRAAMGAMADLGVHKTDLIQWLIGQTVVAATAKIATLDKRDPEGNLVGVDDNALCIYQMSGGAMGTMTASWTYYGPEDNSTVIYGTEGVMRIYDDPAHSIELDLRSGETEYYDVEAIQTNDNQTASGVIDAFVESVTTGGGVPVSGESVLPAMRAVFACIESSKTGATVQIA